MGEVIDAKACLMKADLCCENGDREGAEYYYNLALENIPDNQDTYMKLIDLYKSTELRINDLLPKNEIKVLFDKAISNINNSNYDEAINLLQKVVKSDSNNAQAFYLLGICFQDLDNVKSLEYLNKAVTLNADNSDYYSELATTYSKLCDYDDAISIAQQAITLNPNNDQAQFIIGLSNLKITIKTDEKCFEGLGQMIKYLGPVNKVVRDKWLEMMKKAISLNPHNVGYYVQLFDIYVELNTLYLKVGDYDNASYISKQGMEFYNKMAISYLAKQEYDKAIKNAQRSISLSPVDYKAYFIVGSALAKMGKINDSYEYLKKSNELNPNDESVVKVLNIVKEMIGL